MQQGKTNYGQHLHLNTRWQYASFQQVNTNPVLLLNKKLDINDEFSTTVPDQITQSRLKYLYVL